MKTCPYCAEEIQDAAIVCKHCGRDLNASAPAAKTAPPVSTDVQYLNLQNQLRDLQAQKAKLRGPLYFLFAIVTGVSGIVLMPSLIGFIALGIALASLLAGITAAAKGSNLTTQINQVNDQLQQISNPPVVSQ